MAVNPYAHPSTSEIAIDSHEIKAGLDATKQLDGANHQIVRLHIPLVSVFWCSDLKMIQKDMHKDAKNICRLMLQKYLQKSASNTI